MLHSDTSEDTSPEKDHDEFERQLGLLSVQASLEGRSRTCSPQWFSDEEMLVACRKISPVCPKKSLHDELKDHSVVSNDAFLVENSARTTSSSEKNNQSLPPGWERHEDAAGAFYYWHIPSGTIQRREPTPVTLTRRTPSPFSNNSTHSSSSQRSLHAKPANGLQNENFIGEYINTDREHAKSQRVKIQSSSSQKHPGSGEPIVFAVKSLGWVHVPGEQLSQSELSSNVVEECIKELRKEATEEFGFDTFAASENSRQQLKLVLYDDCVCVFDSYADNESDENRALLSHQPIYLVRVWGTTRILIHSPAANQPNDDSSSPSPTPLLPVPDADKPSPAASQTREEYQEFFAFVARDRYSENYYKCFVYQCIDTPASDITSALNLKCEAYLKQYYSKGKKKSQNYAESGNNNGAERPKSLLGGIRSSKSVQHFHHSQTQQKTVPAFPSSTSIDAGLAEFLTPMQEPKKFIDNLRYVGSMPVPNSTGIEETNNTINMLVEESRIQNDSHDPTLWPEVSVEVSPSMLAIRRVDNDDLNEYYYDDDGYSTTMPVAPADDTATSSTVIECRIRYLSFLGISRDDAHFCGFVIMTPDDAFVCHVVYGEQVSNLAHLCKTVEAACTLRYQKFLDAHSATTTPNSSTNYAVKSITKSWTRGGGVGAANAMVNSSANVLSAKIRGLFSTSWTSLISPSSTSAAMSGGGGGGTVSHL